MKLLALAAAFAGLTGTTGALAQPATPAPYSPAPSPQSSQPAPAGPQLDAAPSAEVKRQVDQYRTEVDGRIARGEITPVEAGRLMQWREWQITQQVMGMAPPPGPIVEEAPAPVVRTYVPYYAPYPYYGPAYYGSAPYYWGARVCAGGFGRHFGGRVCF
jgi:hypothetical protein